MINSSYNISLSSMMAQTKIVENSASNIVNANNTYQAPDTNQKYEGFEPKDVQTSSLADQGVEVNYKTKEPAYKLEANADMEMRSKPNVDVATEAIKMKAAHNTYKANIEAIQTHNEMNQTLMDSFF